MCPDFSTINLLLSPDTMNVTVGASPPPPITGANGGSDVTCQPSAVAFMSSVLMSPVTVTLVQHILVQPLHTEAYSISV